MRTKYGWCRGCGLSKAGCTCPASHLTQRSLDLRTGSEGPQHDPYSFTEMIMTVNGNETRLHLGLGCWLKLNGEMFVPYDEELAVKIWINITGLTPDQFTKAYWRRWPYYPDPMGHPSMYI